MLDRVLIVGRPMLYVTTSCVARTSTIASEVKTSLAIVHDFLTRHWSSALGPPIVSYSNWDGRLVTIEAGFPVTESDAAAADGRVLAGRTPEGLAATMTHRGSPATLEVARAQLNALVAAAGAPVTGLTWEVYLDGDWSGPSQLTALYVQLLEPAGLLPGRGAAAV